MKAHFRAVSFLVLILTALCPAFAQGFNLKSAFAPMPVLLTSIGQSADVEMVKILLNRSKVAFALDAQVKANALSGAKAKTIVLTVGGSSKGLGAAGISVEVELDRTKALIAEARKLGMKIIGIHVGGAGERDVRVCGDAIQGGVGHAGSAEAGQPQLARGRRRHHVADEERRRAERGDEASTSGD